MTRSIKFRAWGNNKMVSMVTKSSLAYIFDFAQVTSGILMQFTGLLDSKGREIYENDLIKCEDGKVREIVWYPLGAGWRLGTDNKDTYFNGLGVYTEKLEVIGNIYENKELITNK